MATDRWGRAEQIFHAALELPPDEREALLLERCAGDARLLGEVRSLVEHDRTRSYFLSAPALGAEFTVRPTEVLNASAHGAFEGALVGGYRLLRQIGRGGMGTVYLAETAHGAAGPPVAIKLIRRGLDSEQVLVRFNRERQTLARLDHPNVAKLLDGGVSDELPVVGPYLVMEYVAGRPIDRYCREEQLALPARLRLFRQVCAAVQYAHQHLIVHRDLKPSNILVTAAGVPKLLDFGISKVLAADADGATIDATATGVRLLTPDYASPEQVRGEPITTASDVYSLGVILYELMTGRRPYQLDHQPPGQVERLICDHDPERPSAAVLADVRPLRRRRTLVTAEGGFAVPAEAASHELERLARRLRGDLDNITLKALRKDPRRRYASVDQLSEDIRSHLDGRPVSARKDTFVYRTAKFIRRNKAAVSAAALVCFSLMFAAGGILWQTRTTALQRDLAEANLAWAEAAERRAAEAALRAKSEAESARRTTEFLIDVFKISDPHEALGETITAREILDRGAERIQSELADQPRTQAMLMDAIGAVYMNLGLYTRAEALFEQALAIRRRSVGERHRETAGSLDGLGNLRRTVGDHRGAVDLLGQALATYRDLSDEDPMRLARSLSNLAVSLYEGGDYRAAEPYLMESLELTQGLLEENAKLRFTVLNNLGGLRLSSGQCAEAIPLFREALELRQASLPNRGEPHPDVALALHNLASAFFEQSEFGEAERLYREALAMRRQLFGTDHPLVATTLNALGAVVQLRGEVSEAEAMAREALAIGQKLPGDAQPLIATSLYNLASLLFQAGDPAAAEPLARQVLSLRRQILAPSHPDVADALQALAAILLTRGMPDEAEPLLRESLDARSAQAGGRGRRHPGAAAALNNLAAICLEKGDYAAAEAYYREALDICRLALGDQHLLVARCLKSLGETLYRDGRLAEASPLFEEALCIHRRVLPAGHPEIAGSLTGLGAVRLGLDDAAAAEPLLREAVEIYHASPTANTWRAALAESLLGGCMTAQGRFAEAEPLVVEGFSFARLVRGDAHWVTRQALERVIELYDAWQRPEEAAQYHGLLDDAPSASRPPDSVARQPT